jgi:RimJ/RimL family protein N-acetyltransferase
MLKPNLRAVEAGDEVDLWRWRNDPETRLNSVKSDEVAWSDHVAWFQSSVANSDRVIYIVEFSGEKYGMVRFDKMTEEARAWEVSIVMSPQFRGRGFGSLALRDACAEMETRDDTLLLRAKIRRHNHPSLKIFERCGFSPEGREGEFVLFARRRGDPSLARA